MLDISRFILLAYFVVSLAITWLTLQALWDDCGAGRITEMTVVSTLYVFY